MIKVYDDDYVICTIPARKLYDYQRYYMTHHVTNADGSNACIFFDDKNDMRLHTASLINASLIQKSVKWHFINAIDAALFVLSAFKPIIGRDVARLIAKLIYHSRRDKDVWIR